MLPEHTIGTFKNSPSCLQMFDIYKTSIHSLIGFSDSLKDASEQGCIACRLARTKPA